MGDIRPLDDRKLARRRGIPVLSFSFKHINHIATRGPYFLGDEEEGETFNSCVDRKAEEEKGANK